MKKHILAIMLLITVVFPIVAFAQSTGSQTYNQFANVPRFGLLVLIILICQYKRKNEIGGWLLYYYIGLYAGFAVSIVMLLISIPNLNPNLWTDKALYLLQLISLIPIHVLNMALVAIGSIMLSKKHRNWTNIRIVKFLYIFMIVFYIISTPIDLILKNPLNIFFNIYGLILSLIWLLYFSRSERVKHVFLHHDWKDYYKKICPPKAEKKDYGEMKCPKCNKEYDSTWKMCLNCNVPLTLNTSYKDYQSEVTK